jgi:hypothetical protein
MNFTAKIFDKMYDFLGVFSYPIYVIYIFNISMFGKMYSILMVLSIKIKYIWDCI